MIVSCGAETEGRLWGMDSSHCTLPLHMEKSLEGHSLKTSFLGGKTWSDFVVDDLPFLQLIRVRYVTRHTPIKMFKMEDLNQTSLSEPQFLHL